VMRTVMATNAFTSFSAIPLQFVTFVGLLSLLATLGLAVQTLYIWATGRAVEGFTTVILLILAIGAVLMISLGIIGQYLAKIYDELKGRPRYLIGRTLRIGAPLQQQPATRK
jgi:glycosyltransferase involved in cell wall biosynthesis